MFELGGDVQFEFRPQYANMSLKFTNAEDSYLFFSDFKEVLSMIPLPNMPQDVVALHLIPFALKLLAQKWM